MAGPSGRRRAGLRPPRAAGSRWRSARARSGDAALERRAQLVRATGSEASGRGALIAAPIIGRGRLLGVIALGDRVSRPIGRSELFLLQAFANRVGEILRTGGDVRPSPRPRHAPLPRILVGLASDCLSGARGSRRRTRSRSRRAPAARRRARGPSAPPRRRRRARAPGASAPSRHHQPQRLAARGESAPEVEQQVDPGAVQVGRVAEVEHQGARGAREPLGQREPQLGGVRAVDLAVDRRRSGRRRAARTRTRQSGPASAAPSPARRCFGACGQWCQPGRDRSPLRPSAASISPSPRPWDPVRGARQLPKSRTRSSIAPSSRRDSTT